MSENGSSRCTGYLGFGTVARQRRNCEGQLRGAEAILTLGGDAVVEDKHKREVLASRSRAIKMGERGRQTQRRIESRRHERCTGRETTRVRTPVIIVYDSEIQGRDGAAIQEQRLRREVVGPDEEDEEEEEEEEEMSSGSEVDSERDEEDGESDEEQVVRRR